MGDSDAQPLHLVCGQLVPSLRSGGPCEMEVVALPGSVVGRLGEVTAEGTWLSPAPGRCSW